MTGLARKASGPIRIAIDAMGGEGSPGVEVEGGLAAVRDSGGAVEVVVWRKGREEIFSVTLGELDLEQVAAVEPELAVPDPDELEIPALGLEVETVSTLLREQFQLEESAEGVLITQVDPEGNGAEKGLTPGDLIVEVDQEAVSSPIDVAERQGEHRWVAVRIGES